MHFTEVYLHTYVYKYIHVRYKATPVALLELNHKSMGIPGTSVSKDRDSTDETFEFDHLSVYSVFYSLRTDRSR